MSTHLTTAFGFQRTVINGRYNLWTCKISIKRYASAIPVIGGIDISFSKTVSKKGRVTEKVILKYATMDYSEHIRMQREIMLYMEQHAINQVKKSYEWLHEPDFIDDPAIDKMSMEDLKDELPW